MKKKYFALSYFSIIAIALGLMYQNMTTSGAIQPAELQIHLSPTGNDRNIGTASSPILSLQRAQDLIHEKFIKKQEPLRPVRILVAPGRYYGQGVNWDTFLKNLPITIEGQGNSKQGVVFVGVSESFANNIFANFNSKLPTTGSSIFLKIPSRNNRYSTPRILQKDGTLNVSRDESGRAALNLTIKGLTIAHYCEAISFFPLNQQILEKVNITNNTFQNIGSMFDPVFDSTSQKRIGACVCALRLVGSQEFKVSDNRFLDNLNLQKIETFKNRYGPGHFHSIYLSNNASRNRIENNLFDHTNGPPLRIRNSSDDNEFIGNTFRNFDYNLYAANGKGDAYLAKNSKFATLSEWYCQPDQPSCEGVKDCKSTSAKLIHNIYDDSFILFNSIATAGARSTCPTNDDHVKIQVEARQNFNSSKGLCMLKSVKACPRQGLAAGLQVIDFANPKWISLQNSTAEEKAVACQDRLKSIYYDCKTSDPLLAIEAQLVIDKQPTKRFEIGNGCVVRGEGCFRMQLNGTERMDNDPAAQQSASRCLARNNSWYASCSKDNVDQHFLISSRYLDGERAVEKISGNGCMISANHCPRMGFIDGQTRLDSKDEAHSDLRICQKRAEQYWNSCTRDMAESKKGNIKVTARFFNRGVEAGKAVFDGKYR